MRGPCLEFSLAAKMHLASVRAPHLWSWRDNVSAKGRRAFILKGDRSPPSSVSCVDAHSKQSSPSANFLHQTRVTDGVQMAKEEMEVGADETPSEGFFFFSPSYPLSEMSQSCHTDKQ